jgi:hypothetical protein
VGPNSASDQVKEDTCCGARDPMFIALLRVVSAPAASASRWLRHQQNDGRFQAHR